MGSFDSLVTAISGLQAQSFALQNISGNIANAQTTAFKSTDTNFQDLLDANTAASFQDSDGVQALSSSTSDIQGTIQTASIPTYMAINGDGYFTVEQPSGTGSDGQPTFAGSTPVYTRRGDFQPDKDGHLVNGAGYYLMGSPVDPSTGAATSGAPQLLQFDSTSLASQGVQSLSVGSQGQIQGVTSNGTTVNLADVPLATFSGEDSLQQGDGETFTPTTGSGIAQFDATGKIVGNALEASNTDIAGQFTTMIMTQQAYDANTKVVTASNEMMQTLTNLTV